MNMCIHFAHFHVCIVLLLYLYVHVLKTIKYSNAARRYDDDCHVSRPLLFVACSFVAQDADATTACSSAVSTHVGVL